jgi:hypothetical protein
MLVTEASSNRTGSQPVIKRQEVADKVYRLMQKDLIVEGERAVRKGG